MTVNMAAWLGRRRRLALLGIAAAMMTATMPLGGCETHSFMDPSVVGRWERTPVTLPILKRLDVIDEEPTHAMELTSVRDEDHIVDRNEYVIGAGDMITITIFELRDVGQEAVLTRVVDETGQVRLPELRSVQVEGRTPSELEAHLRDRLEAELILTDATVSVIIQDPRQKTFSVVGQPATGSTAVGTYVIPKPDFRLFDALAMARGVPERTNTVMIYRRVREDEAVGAAPPGAPTGAAEPAAPEDAPVDPAELIERMFGDQGDDDAPVEPAEPEAPEEPDAPDADAERSQSPWIYEDGRWVRRDDDGPTPAPRLIDDGDNGHAYRIIEIPYQRLLAGDMRYNIVIRPHDIIRVPAPSAGFVYLMGAVNRPGAYTVPGENELTLTRLIASGGNLSQIAIPERVDLTRQIGRDRQTTLRLDLRAIFDGSQPDIYVKPNDLINVGTSFVATPLAIFRNGLRMTYGFGFIFDRNFAPDVFD